MGNELLGFQVGQTFVCDPVEANRCCKYVARCAEINSIQKSMKERDRMGWKEEKGRRRRGVPAVDNSVTFLRPTSCISTSLSLIKPHIWFGAILMRNMATEVAVQRRHKRGTEFEIFFSPQPDRQFRI